MALLKSNIFRNAGYGGSYRSFSRHHKWRKGFYARKCKLCGRKSYGEYCRLCQYSLLQINEIIRLYLEGTPPEDMDKAVAEFDRIYFSNLRLRVFYNTACEAVHCAIVRPHSPIVLSEPDESSIPRPKVLSILEESGIISRQGEKILPGALLKKLIRLRLYRYAISSSEFSKQLRIIYAVLTLKMTKTLLEHREFTPQIVMSIFRMISAHIFVNLKTSKIPREVPSSTWNRGFKGMSRRQQDHVKWDLLGLTPNINPRIFEDYDPERDQYICKECMTYYYEYIRNIIREREVERTR